ncbi:MAG: hypothetical protein HY347_12000 [candidate division NC10 bacterium]|nr:hypothetical protein [candidate division NC10 bacterium]
MSTPWIVVAAVVALGVLYVLLPVVAQTFLRYRRTKVLRCPEAGKEAEVGIDAARAAYTSAFGQPQLQVEDCSLWPERKDCGQDCLGLPETEMQEVRQPQAH